MTHPGRPSASPAIMPKRERKAAVQSLRKKREDNIARSQAAPRVLSQRIGDLFPELKAL